MAFDIIPRLLSINNDFKNTDFVREVVGGGCDVQQSITLKITVISHCQIVFKQYCPCLKTNCDI